MNLQDNFILINGVDKTLEVESIEPDGNRYKVKFQNSDKTYSYARGNVVWMTNPEPVDFENCRVFVKGKKEKNIKAIRLFSVRGKKYYSITYGSDYKKHYQESDVDIRRSCLSGSATALLDYFRSCAGVNKLGIDGKKVDEDARQILLSIYEKVDFIDEETAAAVYLDPARGIRQRAVGTPLFPFGCNASQEKAVNIALSNQFSVIQGPPGTGKTQTILNIIANLIVAGKSVLVVSNNNNATQNVLEKLTKNGLGFVVAPLGNRINKEAFIAGQPPLSAELPSWTKSDTELNLASSAVRTSLERVRNIFELQGRLATCRQELADVSVEMSHYKKDYEVGFEHTNVNAPSARILGMSRQIKDFASRYQDNCNGLPVRVKCFFDRLVIGFRLRFMLGIKDRLTLESATRIVSLLDWQFYVRRVGELKSEIESIESQLSQLNAKAEMSSLTENSMTILKATLAERFQHERRKIESVKELYKSGETVLHDYPVVLSTTFSSKSCFDSDILFDYVIMDEASQVSVDTGLLALTCARNAVIVGDTKQLPNIVKDDDRAILEEIGRACKVNAAYDAANHNFL